ncbi:MAG: tripartite tricarboxylate transporter substrate binding protein [Alphaproteobacteria bacterium]
MIALTRLVTASMFLLASAGGLSAQTFPQRPVTILVPFAAGGAVDIVARTLADQLARIWGQQPIVENRPGAGGVVASQALVRAAPDGHTILVVANGHPLNRFFYPRLPYDTDRDFTPITQIAASPLVVAVGKGETAADAKTFFASQQSRAPSINFGVSGFGTSAHLAGLLIGQATGIKFVPVPHRSGSQALQTVMGGDIPMSINPLLEVLSLARGGQVRALAVTSATRSSALPDVPTLAESGLSGFDTGVWWGIVAPAGLPSAVMEKLTADLRAAIRTPETLARLEQLGASPVASTPSEFISFLAAETAKWGPIIRAADVKIE